MLLQLLIAVTRQLLLCSSAVDMTQSLTAVQLLCILRVG